MNIRLQFANPSILLLLWLIPAITWLWIRLRKRSENKLKQFISGPMQAKLRFPVSKGKLLAQIIAVTLGIAFLIISVAGPFAGFRDETVTNYSHDIIVLLDVSSSMTAKDVQPDRLNSAKSIIIETSSKLTQDRLALIAFRHETTLLCPLTYDLDFLHQAIKLASTSSAPAGETDIGNAITTATALFADDSPAHKIIILFSDGEDLSTNTEKAIALASKNNITIFTIGIGTKEGSTIPDPLRIGKEYVFNGNTVISKLNEQMLRKIATETDGEYISNNNHISPSDMCVEYLRGIKATAKRETMKKLRIYRYNWFLLPAFIFFLSAVVLGTPKKAQPHKRVTPTNKSLLLLISLSLTTLITSAGATSPKNALYPSDTACRIFALRANATHNKIVALVLRTKSDEQPHSPKGYDGQTDISSQNSFNTASEHFATTNYTQAIATLDSIRTNNTGITSRINMAYGCTYFKIAEKLNDIQEQSKLYQKATESFLAVLKQNANNPIAEHNLAVSYRSFQVAVAKLEKAEHKKTDTQNIPENRENSADKSQEDRSQQTEKPLATDAQQQNNDLSQEEIDDILSTILSREKEYQTKKQRYGKLVPLQSDVKDY